MVKHTVEPESRGFCLMYCHGDGQYWGGHMLKYKTDIFQRLLELSLWYGLLNQNIVFCDSE